MQQQTTNLADLILEKIAEHEAKLNGENLGAPYIQGGGVPEDAVQIPAKAVEVYEKYATPTHSLAFQANQQIPGLA